MFGKKNDADNGENMNAQDVMSDFSNNDIYFLEYFRKEEEYKIKYNRAYQKLDKNDKKIKFEKNKQYLSSKFYCKLH